MRHNHCRLCRGPHCRGLRRDFLPSSTYRNLSAMNSACVDEALGKNNNSGGRLGYCRIWRELAHGCWNIPKHMSSLDPYPGFYLDEGALSFITCTSTTQLSNNINQSTPSCSYSPAPFPFSFQFQFHLIFSYQFPALTNLLDNTYNQSTLYIIHYTIYYHPTCSLLLPLQFKTQHANHQIRSHPRTPRTSRTSQSPKSPQTHPIHPLSPPTLRTPARHLDARPTQPTHPLPQLRRQ